jgi:hypothetical protein
MYCSYKASKCEKSLQAGISFMQPYMTYTDQQRMKQQTLLALPLE